MHTTVDYATADVVWVIYVAATLMLRLATTHAVVSVSLWASAVEYVYIADGLNYTGDSKDTKK